MRFLRQAIKNPKTTGAVIASSSFLAECIVEKAKLSSAKVVVELGVGTGAFTKKILEGLEKDAQYLGIEINQDFVNIVRQEYPGATIIHDSAENLRTHLHENGHETCDRIISGIPWAAIEYELQESLLAEIYASLSEGGLFLTFAYWPINHMKNGKSFNQKLQKYFNSVERTAITLNLPPAFVYICQC
ncbi:MAG: methyltransferase domain-containing protein [Candidatus Peregrinibacteria bacterium]|nr:methyltransferase domain-containing protein [Candidatus Peregrinibacteria bacterium]